MMLYIQMLALTVMTLGPQTSESVDKIADGAKKETTQILILKEGGIGSASTGQQYVDRLVSSVARVNQWPQAKGKYQTSRKLAEAWIAEEKPDFAILSIAAFLQWRTSKGLKVVGSAEVGNAGGRSYHIVSRVHKKLEGCRGKVLASDHVSDKKFVERVVAKGAFKLTDFVVQETRRPVQTIKKVVRDEAACALIDDAQLKSLAKISGGEALQSVWSSQSLPPMVVAAFPQVATAKKKRFKSSLSKVCNGEGKSACEEAGIRKLSPADHRNYRGIISSYGK